MATHVACLIWSRTLKCSNTLNLQDFHCSVRLILRRQLRKMQNASNGKRKVSTNYLSGNHRLSVRVHATATPVQAVHARTERTIVNESAKRRCVSPALRKQLHFQEQSTTAKQQNTCLLCRCLTGKTKSSRQPEMTSIPLQLRANSRGAGETHCRVAGSFTIVLSVLTCRAWAGVAVACTLTDSLYKYSELSTGR